MKYHFHILFAAVLLLGSFILLHNQKSDSIAQTREIPAMEDIHLAAELPVQRTIESSLNACRHQSLLEFKDITERYRDVDNLRPDLCQIRAKTQLKLFLEIKPILNLISGQYFYHPSSYGDPPGSES